MMIPMPRTEEIDMDKAYEWFDFYCERNDIEGAERQMLEKAFEEDPKGFAYEVIHGVEWSDRT